MLASSLLKWNYHSPIYLEVYCDDEIKWIPCLSLSWGTIRITFNLPVLCLSPTCLQASEDTLHCTHLFLKRLQGIFLKKMSVGSFRGGPEQSVTGPESFSLSLQHSSITGGRGVAYGTLTAGSWTMRLPACALPISSSAALCSGHFLRWLGKGWSFLSMKRLDQMSLSPCKYGRSLYPSTQHHLQGKASGEMSICSDLRLPAPCSQSSPSRSLGLEI